MYTPTLVYKAHSPVFNDKNTFLKEDIYHKRFFVLDSWIPIMLYFNSEK